MVSAMDTGLSGKRVLVTGASGGIGAACARLFAAEDCRVVVHYNTGRERAEAVAADCGGNALLVQADLTREADAERLYSESRAALGGLDVCVAVAGIWPEEDVPLWQLPLDRWQETLAANLTATFLTARGFLQEVERSGHGNLVLVGSTAGLFGEAGHADYASAKSAIVRGLAPQPEERDRADRAAGTRQRGLPGLDGVADDPLHAGRAGPRRPHHEDDAPPQGRRARGRRAPDRRPRLRRALRPRDRVRSSWSPGGMEGRVLHDDAP